MEETTRSCFLCVYGNKLSCSEDIICEKKGVLSEDMPCKKFKEDLTKRIVRKKRSVKITL